VQNALQFKFQRKFSRATLQTPIWLRTTTYPILSPFWNHWLHLWQHTADAMHEWYARCLSAVLCLNKKVLARSHTSATVNSHLKFACLISKCITNILDSQFTPSSSNKEIGAWLRHTVHTILYRNHNARPQSTHLTSTGQLSGAELSIVRKPLWSLQKLHKNITSFLSVVQFWTCQEFLTTSWVEFDCVLWARLYILFARGKSTRSPKMAAVRPFWLASSPKLKGFFP